MTGDDLEYEGHDLENLLRGITEIKTHPSGNSAGIPFNRVPERAVRVEFRLNPSAVDGKMFPVDRLKEGSQVLILIRLCHLIPHRNADTPCCMQQLVVWFYDIVDRDGLLNIDRDDLRMLV